MKNFPCNQCGACCRNVNLAKETEYLDRGDGICVNYDEVTRLCLIYQTRPSICRVDEHYVNFFREVMEWESYVSMNMNACEILRAKDGVDIKV